jgi:hypothetical protein
LSGWRTALALPSPKFTKAFNDFEQLVLLVPTGV